MLSETTSTATSNYDDNTIDATIDPPPASSSLDFDDYFLAIVENEYDKQLEEDSDDELVLVPDTYTDMQDDDLNLNKENQEVKNDNYFYNKP